MTIEEVDNWLDILHLAGQIHLDRLESIKWLPDEEAAKKWNERSS